MGEIKILGGDFSPAMNANFYFNMFGFIDHLNETDESIPADQLQKVVIASEEMVQQFNAGRGALGAFALGPIGLLAAGESKHNVTFVAKFKDGRKLLGATDRHTYREIKKLAPETGLGFTKAQQEIVDKADAQLKAREDERKAKKEAQKKRDVNNLWVLLAFGAFIIFIAAATANL